MTVQGWTFLLVGLTFAVPAHQLGAQRVEAVEAGPPIGRDAGLELGDRTRQLVELGVAEVLQPAEPLLGADPLEFDRQRVVAEILGGARARRFPVGVLGMGTIGRTVGDALSVFDYPINGWSRSSRRRVGSIANCDSRGRSARATI